MTEEAPFLYIERPQISYLTGLPHRRFSKNICEGEKEWMGVAYTESQSVLH